MTRPFEPRASLPGKALLLTFSLTASLLIVARAPTSESPPKVPAYSADLVKQIVADTRTHGDARRGALVFRSATLACLSCHKVGGQGGTVGPDLSTAGKCSTPEYLVESVLWPKRQVKPEYVAILITTSDGRSVQG